MARYTSDYGTNWLYGRAPSAAAVDDCVHVMICVARQATQHIVDIVEIQSIGEQSLHRLTVVHSITGRHAMTVVSKNNPPL